MKAFDETVLRDQLRTRGETDVTVVSLKRMQDYPFINPPREMPARDYIHSLYAFRLEGALKRQPENSDLHTKLRSVVAALEATDDDEALYSWRAVASRREVFGFSTPTQLVLYSPDFFPDERIA
jgi:hypothetical protein